MTVKHHQEADFGIEKLPHLTRHAHRARKSPHEIITEADETKASTDLDQQEEADEEAKKLQHIFSDYHRERKLSYLIDEQFLIKEEDEQTENEDEEEENAEEN